VTENTTKNLKQKKSLSTRNPAHKHFFHIKFFFKLQVGVVVSERLGVAFFPVFAAMRGVRGFE